MCQLFGFLRKRIYFCDMAFLRVENKKSGSYIRIVESYRNNQGKSVQRILYNLGKVEGYTPEELQRIGRRLFELGGGDLKALLGVTSEKARYNYGYYQLYSKILNHYGLDIILQRVQKKHKLGFDLINSVLLMLMERLHDPCSKRSSYFNQTEYLGIQPLELQYLYRALDKLSDYNKLIQKQIYQTGRDLFNQTLDLVFYDVTTLYFDSEDEKEGHLRQKGFGKDGKIGKTQILFCMLIDRNKQPVGYHIFEGNKYEGHTFTHALETLKKEYLIDKVIVVADRGMINDDNLELTIKNNYEFIIGERLRSLPQPVQEYLLDQQNYKSVWCYFDNQQKEVKIKYCTLEYQNRTIIGTFSEKRAKKDRHEREHKLEVAQKLLSQPSQLKKKASYYFLQKQGKDTYVLNEEKIKRDEKFDGFLAVATNNIELTEVEVLEQYKQLYKIEHTFRTFKSHLEMRPMFHWNDKRIKGHICMCYIAFTLLNYTLMALEKSKNNLSENQLRKILDSMQVSLIEQEGKQIYLRSAQKPMEKELQQTLGLKQLPNILPTTLFSQYI